MSPFGCWPANLVAIITVLIILFDLVNQQWSSLPMHAIAGVAVTGVFWLLCFFLGSSISGAVLYVPLLVLIVFALGIFFTQESMRRQGCCVTCASTPPPVEAKPVDDKCKMEQQVLKGMPMV